MTQIAGTNKASVAVQEVDIDLLVMSDLRPAGGIPVPEPADVLLAQQAGIHALPTVVVRLDGTRFEILRGIRVWRVAQALQLPRLPVLVVSMDDTAAARAVAADFQDGVARNPVDEGEYLSWMTTEKGVSIVEASRSIGLSRTEGSHRLRVLRLPQPIKELLRTGDLTLGHGRLLLSLGGALSERQLIALAQEASKQGLSIQDLHDRAMQLSGQGTPSTQAAARDPNVVRMENVLSAKLGTPVRIDYTNTGEGILHIEFDSFSILDGVLDHLGYEG